MSATSNSDQSTPALINVARCPEHGLHGLRTECFECGGPVDQVVYAEAGRMMVVAEERDRLRAEVEALRAAKNEWVAGYGDGLGDSRTEIAALKAERDRLRAENEALKEQARVACRQAIELDKANGALLQALEQAWVSAHENHRAIKRRDVDCTMRPCPQIRAAVAFDEQQLPNWWCGHCGRRRTVVERPDCPGCGHREFVNRPAGEWPNGTAASHPTPEEGR